MTTVKQIKDGTEMPEPIYIEKPYLVIGNKEKIVLHAGTIESIKEISSYYDDCSVEVRRHDLYLNDNTRLPNPVMKVWALMEGGSDEPIEVRLMGKQERDEEKRKADEATDGNFGWVEYHDPRTIELLEVLENSWPVIAALARGEKPDTWVMRRIEQHMVDAIAKAKND